jgi:hypothetical protein
MGSKPLVNTAALIQNHGKNSTPSIAPNRASRPWQVLHSCESVTQIADILAGELAVGMRPSVITPEGFVLFTDALRMKQDKAAQISLLNAWNDVRHWRKVILDADPLAEFDLLHAHSFAAGMAGVRNYPATVYELDQFIEDSASGVASRTSTNPVEHGSWLSRSFRVAEQFVLSRAAAVVVRTESIRQAVARRGAAAENVFAVPAALNEEEMKPAEPDQVWLQSLGIDREAHVLMYAPQWKMELADDGSLTEASRGLLEALAVAASEAEGVHLLVECEDSAQRQVNEFSEKLRGRITLIDSANHHRAFDAAEIIVADSYPSISATPIESATSRQALLLGKTLLAADLPCNRDVTPAGRGCLWYRSGDYKDIAHRMAFLARNPDFRASLAEAGTRHLIESCNSAAIAMLYDNIYRHAAARRKSGGLQTPAIRLTPASAML